MFILKFMSTNGKFQSLTLLSPNTSYVGPFLSKDGCENYAFRICRTINAMDGNEKPVASPDESINKTLYSRLVDMTVYMEPIQLTPPNPSSNLD